MAGSRDSFLRQLVQESVESGFTPLEARTRAYRAFRKVYKECSLPHEEYILDKEKPYDTAYVLVSRVLERLNDSVEYTKRDRRKLRSLLLCHVKEIGAIDCYDLFSRKELERVFSPDAHSRRRFSLKPSRKGGKNWSKKSASTIGDLMRGSGVFKGMKAVATNEFKMYREKLQQLVKEITDEGNF